LHEDVMKIQLIISVRGKCGVYIDIFPSFPLHHNHLNQEIGNYTLADLTSSAPLYRPYGP